MKYLLTEKENLAMFSSGYQTVKEETFNTLAEAQIAMLGSYSDMLKYIVGNYDLTTFDYAVGTKSAHITEFSPEGTNRKFFNIKEIGD